MTCANENFAAPESKSRGGTGGRRWMFWLRIAAGAAVVGWLARHTQWQPVEQAIQRMAWSHWAAALGIFLCSQMVSGWRWAEIARPLGFNFSRLRYVQLYFEGMFFNLCLPVVDRRRCVEGVLACAEHGRAGVGRLHCAGRSGGGIGRFGRDRHDGARGPGLWLPIGSAVLVAIGLLAAALAAVSLGLRVWKWLAGFLPAEGRLARLAEQLMPYHDRPECGAVVDRLGIARASD